MTSEQAEQCVVALAAENINTDFPIMVDGHFYTAKIKKKGDVRLDITSMKTIDEASSEIVVAAHNFNSKNIKISCNLALLKKPSYQFATTLRTFFIYFFKHNMLYFRTFLFCTVSS